MKKWEHKIIVVENIKAEEVLKNEGSEGWELCSVIYFQHTYTLNFFFKREIFVDDRYYGPMGMKFNTTTEK